MAGYHSRKRNILAPSAVGSLAVTSHVFAWSSALSAVITALFIVAPIWRPCRTIIRSPWLLAPLALAYGLLLSWSWEPDMVALILPGNLADGFNQGFNPQFFPKLAGVATLFSRVPTAASLWIHLLAIDVFAARAIVLDGESAGLPVLCLAAQQ